jgi:GDP-D-mannose dehydratase
MIKRAFITGVGGQDGSYLAEYLLSLGYEVHGIIRRNSTPEHQQSRLDEIRDKINIYYGDLLDQSNIERLLSEIQPDEIYNLAAQSHVRISYDIPQFTSQANFVTNKVVKAAVMISLGLSDKLELGNMDSYRDWGHSKDYVKAMHLILQQDKPVDLVVATGESRSVRDMCEYVFSKLNLNYKDYVVQNDKFLRPEELPYLKGDSSKIRSLGWKPEYSFETMMDEMIDYWLNIYKK